MTRRDAYTGGNSIVKSYVRGEQLHRLEMILRWFNRRVKRRLTMAKRWW
jgi:hypothetical protein